MSNYTSYQSPKYPGYILRIYEDNWKSRVLWDESKQDSVEKDVDPEGYIVWVLGNDTYLRTSDIDSFEEVSS